jgi:hypothetical protein
MSILSALEAERQGYPALARLLLDEALASPIGVQLTAEQRAFLNEVYPDEATEPRFVVMAVTPDAIEHCQFDDWDRAFTEYLAWVGLVAGQSVNGVPGFVELSSNVPSDEPRRYGDEQAALKAYYNGKVVM